jgi:hypothetical protein
VRLGKIPDVKFTPRPAVTAERARHIKTLIAELAKIDSQDFGLSPTLNGHDFAPVARQSNTRGGLLTVHEIKPSVTLKELVSIGPDALSFLLDALDDETPTKLVIKHDGFFGRMEHRKDLESINPVNPAETAVYRARNAAKSDVNRKGEALTSYAVTVGDVCFVAIGQIVGREYQAVCYFPTANVFLSSPAHDAKLRADVRAIWSSTNPAKKLFDSLLADYATEAIANGDSFPEGWTLSSDARCGAALRLLYYFPKESTGLVAKQLEGLDIAGNLGAANTDDELQGRRDTINGLDTAAFIKAVSWCDQPPVRSALKSIFERTTDRRILLASLDAIEDREKIQVRLESLIDKLPVDGNQAYEDGEALLCALLDRFPGSAKPVFERCLRGGSPLRCETVCDVLWIKSAPWAEELLGPLLDDRRELSRTGTSIPKRVCDVAALALTENYPELEFELAGTHTDRDKQIAVIREQLKRKK